MGQTEKQGHCGIEEVVKPKVQLPTVKHAGQAHGFCTFFFFGDIVTQVELAGSWVAFCFAKLYSTEH